jgi:hypothetical protein
MYLLGGVQKLLAFFLQKRHKPKMSARSLFPKRLFMPAKTAKRLAGGAQMRSGTIHR